MNRAQFRHLHSWLGVKLAIFLCFILLTGTLAVVSSEIDWLVNPSIRSEPVSNAQDIAWTTIYENSKSQLMAKEASVNAYKIVSINAPLHAGFAASVTVKNPKGERSRLYFNPASGAYQGSGTWFNWQTALRRLHRHLMLPATLGITLVTLTSFLFLGLLLTGLNLYQPWLKTVLKGLVTIPRTNNVRIFFSDLHKLLALWSVWLLFIVSITGVWYLAERWGARATYPENPSALSVEAKSQATMPTNKQLNNMLKSVLTERPDLALRRILFPTKAGEVVLFEGQSNQLLVRDRANNLAFDPVSGQLLSTRHADTLSLHVRISEAADPLHFGTWSSYASKTIYFVFGTFLTLVSITGTYIYALRVSARQKSATASERISTAFSKQGVGATLSLALVIISLFSLFIQGII